ncbi:hypothetical protein VTK26DRAFT_1929 [Humicola hyalothermophila]
MPQGLSKWFQQGGPKTGRDYAVASKSESRHQQLPGIHPFKLGTAPRLTAVRYRLAPGPLGRRHHAQEQHQGELQANPRDQHSPDQTCCPAGYSGQ